MGTENRKVRLFEIRAADKGQLENVKLGVCELAGRLFLLVGDSISNRCRLEHRDTDCILRLRPKIAKQNTF